ncbi:MAG: hypothetical protein M1832_003786 [Thelocarpon impressellum]|nr:MAG: hypothetical protein M1832_003786 [Thelocarpon impressellum]
MRRLSCSGPFCAEPNVWEDRYVSECTNVPAGYCCNNIFFYLYVDVTGLGPRDEAFAFNRIRDGASAGAVADPIDRHAHEAAAGTYGCQGFPLEGGQSDLGVWHYSGSRLRAASGALWLGCDDDPERVLQEALRPRPTRMTRTALASLLRLVVHGCQNMAPRGRRRRRGLAGETGVTAVAAKASLQEVSEGWADVGGEDGAAAEPSEASQAAAPPAARGWVLPDRLTINGTVYASRARNELKYYDDAGVPLNLTKVAEEIRPPADAVAPSQAPAPSATDRGD